MNIKKVLFPTDFSHYNDRALRFASTFAAEAHATLYIVHVHEPRDVSVAAMDEPSYLLASTVEDDREVRQRLNNVVPTVADVTFAHHYLLGSPVTEILSFAERENIDLIVMASHGRTGLSRLLMGSIAEGVMRKAHCPVLIVKQPVGEHDTAGAVAAHAAEI